jgi:BlaI family transcriptional regulator, penicillinase repressor
METNSGMGPNGQTRTPGPRHSILDLAPLELECLSVLWPMGEGTVGDIHRALAASRPRAYTTVLTIMDRLAQKEIVTRRKVGKAFHYQARLSAEEARLKAVEKIVQGFFDGSPEALAAHLSSRPSQPAQPSEAQPAAAAPGERPRELRPAAPAAVDAPATRVAESRTQNLDERLL